MYVGSCQRVDDASDGAMHLACSVEQSSGMNDLPARADGDHAGPDAVPNPSEPIDHALVEVLDFSRCVGSKLLVTCANA